LGFISFTPFIYFSFDDDADIFSSLRFLIISSFTFRITIDLLPIIYC